MKAADCDEEARVLEYRRNEGSTTMGLPSSSPVSTRIAQTKKQKNNNTIDELKAGMQSETVQASMDQLGMDPKSVILRGTT